MTDSEHDARNRAQLESAADTMPAAPIRWRRVATRARRKAVLSVLGTCAIGAVVIVVVFVGGYVGRLKLHRYEKSPIAIPFVGKSVPDVVGTNVEEATASLSGVGLKGVVAGGCRPDRSLVVRSTHPEPGSNVLSGADVQLDVSCTQPVACEAFPTISRQPASQSVTATGTASFSLQEGTIPAQCSPVSIQWQVSTDEGRTWSEVRQASDLGASTPTLEVDPATAPESGDRFRAVLTDDHGATPSHAATLTVITPCSAAPSVTRQPEGRTATETESVTFTVAMAATSSACKAPTVKWESRAPGGSFAPILGASSTSYRVKAEPELSGDEYEALLTGSTGRTTKSHVARLTVSSCAPKIEKSPESQTVKEGVAVTFEVALAPTPSACKPTTVQWESRAHGGSFSPIVGEHSMSFSVKAEVERSGDEYEAVLTSSTGLTTTSTVATLMVSEPEGDGAGGDGTG